MVAPLFKKNTLEQTQFSVDSSGISYKGRRYGFDDVVETRGYSAIFQTRYIPMGVTTSHDPAMTFLLVMRSGEQIQVTEQSTWLSTSKYERVEQLQKAFDDICRVTFDKRVQKYVTQVEQSGFFEYSSWRFSPQQQTFVDTRSGRAHAASEVDLPRSYGFIEVIARQEGMAARLLRKSKEELTGRRYGIVTIADTDAFFALLAHYFQIRWSS